jgi:hypothetical protein
MRSLDYLASRPEIDPKRLGCTGCSGGGTLTSYLMALDERIVAAAPSCYLTSLERLFATIGPQDAEQNITGQVAFGMEHSDYVLMHSPRPTLICAATRDFFDIQGTWTTFREAKRMYGLLGYGERMDLFESDSGHGFPKPQREAALRFMRRWLLNTDDAPTETEIATLKDADLQCTSSGQVLAQLHGQSVFDLNAERADALATLRRSAARNPADLKAEVYRAARGLPHRPSRLRDGERHHGARTNVCASNPTTRPADRLSARSGQGRGCGCRRTSCEACTSRSPRARPRPAGNGRDLAGWPQSQAGWLVRTGVHRDLSFAAPESPPAGTARV